MRKRETERLWLRTLSANDWSRIEELAGDFEVAKTTLGIPHPYPEGSSKEFIEHVLEAEQQNKMVTFGVMEKETESLIGIVNISNILAYQRGEIAYWIGKPYWGKGYGTEAARSLVQFGFEELELNRIYAYSFTTNPGSWKVMEKIGLKYEGTLRQHVSRFGEFHDLACYGILREQYTGQ